LVYISKRKKWEKLTDTTKKIQKYIEQISFLHVIKELADSRNESIYIVGGFLRDIILDKSPDEIDFLVVGDGIEFANDLAKKLSVENVSVFKRFGTAHFYYGGYNLEFVMSRRESYNYDSRNPVVERGSFEDDISRRDFTINTLALSLNSNDFGNLIDIYNGLDDIKNRIIKTPIDPYKTFEDDPLRIMRAFRFASRLNFSINQELLLAIKEKAERLKIITQERITDEFLKIMLSPRPSVGLIGMYQTGVLKYVFPELDEMAGVEQRKDFHHKDVFYHTCEVVDNISAKTENLWLRMAALLHDVAKPATKKFIDGIGWTFHGHEELGARFAKVIFNRMKFPLVHLQYVQNLIRLHLRPIALVDDDVTDSAIRRLIVQAGNHLDDLFELCRADITSKNQGKVTRYLQNYDKVVQKIKDVREKDELRNFQSPVKGEEIMRIFNLQPSKKVGEIKKTIEEAIIDGIIPNNYEAAFNYLMEIKHKFEHD
jgi:tRNA nucleotidyltransferase/poly(A) polymerase